MVSTLFYTLLSFLCKGRWNYFPVVPLQKQTRSLKVICFVRFRELLFLNPKGKGWLFGSDVKFYSGSFYCITWSSLILYIDSPLACVNLNKTNNSVGFFFTPAESQPCCAKGTLWQTHLLSQWDRCNLFLTLSPFIPAVMRPCLLWHSLCICSREQIRICIARS